MNTFKIDENKRLKLCTKSKWYVGESDFEKIVVTMPSQVSGNDMSEWLEDVRLYAVKGGLKWYRTLTFTLDNDTYTSNEVDVDSAWCLTEGEVIFYVQFSDGEDLGKTNTVTVEIHPSEDESILYDGFATEDWVRDYVADTVPTALSDLDDDSTHRVVTDNQIAEWNAKADVEGLIYGGTITAYSSGTATVTLSDEMKIRLNTENDTADVLLTSPSFDSDWLNVYLISNIEFSIGYQRLFPSGSVILMPSTTNGIIRRIYYVQGGSFELLAPLVISSSEPPTESVAAYYPNGTIWRYAESSLSTATIEFYICVRQEYRGSGFVHWWRRIDYTALSELSDDEDHRTVTDDQIDEWDAKAEADTAVAVLWVEDWSNKTQTVYVEGMTADCIVIVSPSTDDIDAAASAKIYCTAQGSNSLTFTCKTTPSDNITFNVVMIGG